MFGGAETPGAAISAAASAAIPSRGGRLEICGWTPEGAPSAPRWMRFANLLDWYMLGLFILVDVLVLLGLVVAHAEGLLPANLSAAGVPAPDGVASAARLH